MQLRETQANRYELTEALKDLSNYIDYTIPAAAVADTPQLPAYRSYDIGIVFNDSYIEQLYHMAGLTCSIRLTDNNEQVVTNANGEPLLLANEWGDNPEVCLTREEIHYQEILDSSGCIVMTTAAEAESTNELIGSSRELLLLPLKQYRAELVVQESIPLYSFAFQVSRYASFLHHAHSFADTLWNHFELLDNDDYAIDVPVFDLVLHSAVTEYIKFDQLMNIFDLHPRSLPQQTELTLLNDKTGSYGWLFESAEPLEWDRCECLMTSSRQTTAIDYHAGSIKIIAGNAAPAEQTVSILLMATTDLSDFTVSYQQGKAAIVEYYRFPAGSRYNAGTLITIHNDTEPVAELPVEHINLYTGVIHEFKTGDTLFQITSSTNEIMHARLYLAARFSDQAIDIIRNEDGTRCFIFLPKGTSLYSAPAAGTYRLEWKYKRNTGDTKPVLKRFGFDSVETAILEFAVV